MECPTAPVASLIAPGIQMSQQTLRRSLAAILGLKEADPTDAKCVGGTVDVELTLWLEDAFTVLADLQRATVVVAVAFRRRWDTLAVYAEFVIIAVVIARALKIVRYADAVLARLVDATVIVDGAFRRGGIDAFATRRDRASGTAT